MEHSVAMTKKDYKAIAAIICNNRDNEPDDDTNWFYIADRIIDDLAVYLAQDNPQFDCNRWTKACHGDN